MLDVTALANATSEWENIQVSGEDDGFPAVELANPHHYAGGVEAVDRGPAPDQYHARGTNRPASPVTSSTRFLELAHVRSLHPVVLSAHRWPATRPPREMPRCVP